jgi:type II secretory pathway component PulM
VLKYLLLLALALTAYWMYRRASPRSQQLIGALLLLLLAAAVYFLVVLPLLHPAG